MSDSKSTDRNDHGRDSGLRSILEDLQKQDIGQHDGLNPKDLENQFMSTLDACREAKMMVDISHRSLGSAVYEDSRGDHSKLVLEVKYAREIQSLLLKQLSRINKLRAG